MERRDWTANPPLILRESSRGTRDHRFRKQRSVCVNLVQTFLDKHFGASYQKDEFPTVARGRLDVEDNTGLGGGFLARE